MRIAITCNGPGETAGWLRPLLREMYDRQPKLEAAVYYVPDDYATGAEAQLARALFPNAHVFDPAVYVRVALGAKAPALPRVDAVLYLGGDLMHAARLARRLNGDLLTYKFLRRRYAAQTLRAFAVDAQNAQELVRTGISQERVRIAGNLAVDGAALEAQALPEPGAPHDGLLIMPGSRSYEVEHLVPFFFTAALAINREDPALPIAFGISPFTSRDELAAAVAGGGDPRMFARAGRLVEEHGRLWLGSLDGRVRFPVLHNAMSAARSARLALTIPGTKVIELASLGVPVVTCTPLNAPELAAINGPLTYLDRLPLVGTPAKRAVVTAYSRRHRFHTQPNIDAQTEIVHELHGTLTPGRVARVVLLRASDGQWLASAANAMGALYRQHAGAAARMAAGILTLERAAT